MGLFPKQQNKASIEKEMNGFIVYLSLSLSGSFSVLINGMVHDTSLS